MSVGPRKRRLQRSFLAAAALAALTLATFWPATGHEFVAYDDERYVTDNPWVRRGLTAEGARWAVTSVGYASNWHPLTWLSHMADAQIFGLDPGPHHAVNIGLHAAAAVALLLVLGAATGAPWRSALTAALFAVHPLRVESVAWVAERKDVLSALLFWLAAGAHLRYVRRPGAARYALLLLAFALGLSAKPMLVTFPLVLLLLDWWPLGRRFGRAPRGSVMAPGSRVARSLRHPVVEKLPLFALAAGAGVLTLAAQRRSSSVTDFDVLGAGLRLANAVNSVVIYLVQALWPAKLSVFYPYPTHGWGSLPWWRVALAAALILSVTIAAYRLRRRLPALAAGWGWYLVMLAPVLGLVNVGIQARADRYTYLPLVGVFVAAVWAVPAPSSRRGAAGRAASALALVAAFAVLARVQTGVWRTSVTLFQNAAAATANNWMAYLNLARAHRAAGHAEEAVAAYREALRILPYLHEERVPLAVLLNELGRPAEAAEVLRVAVQARPDLWQARFNLGNACFALGQLGQAVAEYRAAIALQPADPAAYNNLGVALSALGRHEEARRQFSQALLLDPDLVDARYNDGVALFTLGKKAEAAAQWREVLRRSPGNAKALRSLAQAP